MTEKKAPEQQRSTVEENVDQEAKNTDEEDEDTEDVRDEDKIKETAGKDEDKDEE